MKHYRRFAFIRQEGATDCAPACLAMIAQYYGRQFSIEALRKLCGTTAQGTTLLHLMKGAESIDLEAVSGQMDWAKLISEAPLPCIVLWDQSHYVVVYRIQKDWLGRYRVHVADPQKGLLKYSKEGFCRHWGGVREEVLTAGTVLLLHPTALFNQVATESEQINDKWKFIQNTLKPYRKYVILLVLGLILAGGIQLLFPLLIKAYGDYALDRETPNLIQTLFWIQIILLVSGLVISYIRNKMVLHISSKMNLSFISDFLLKLMLLPINFYKNRYIGDVLHRIDDYRKVEEFLTTQVVQILFSLVTFFVFAGVLLVYSPFIFSVFIIATLLYILWIMLFIRKRKILESRVREIDQHQQRQIFEIVHGVQEVKLQGCEQSIRRAWLNTQDRFFEVKSKLLKMEQTIHIGSTFIIGSRNILVIALSVFSVYESQMTIGMLLAIMYIIGQLYFPMDELIKSLYFWQDLNLSLSRIKDISEEEDETTSERTLTQFDTAFPDITLENLSFNFNYFSYRKVLNKVSLRIPAQKTTVIVGADGSGKSTLLKLLLGFYSPTEGKIKIGNSDLQDMNLMWWRSQCGAILPDSYIFTDTIARNISLSDSTPDMGKIKRAARYALLDSYIENLPFKYNTLIGQDRSTSSIELRERILIARLIYKDPSFVFLDIHHFSQTDSISLSRKSALLSQWSDKTILAITHQLHLLQDADHIIVLDKGEVVAQGSHESLLKSCSTYSKIVKNQLVFHLV